MKKLHTERQLRSCSSYIATAKRKRSEALFTWLKQAFCKSMGVSYRD